jgi:hypothetical protein
MELPDDEGDKQIGEAGPREAAEPAARMRFLRFHRRSFPGGGIIAGDGDATNSISE